MRTLIISLLAGSMATAVAAQDIIFEAAIFDNSASGGTAEDPFKDVDAFSSAESSFLVGNNPVGIAYDGSNVYISGIFNTSAEQVAIAEISDFFGTAGAKQVLGSPIFRNDNVNTNGRGWTGLAWDDRFGLLASLDRGNTFPGLGPQLYLFNRTDPGDFSATLQKSYDGIRGISGPAYDYAFDGNGFMLSDGSMGPAAALPILTLGAAYGYDPTSEDPFDDLYGVDSINPPIYFGNPNDPEAALYFFFSAEVNSSTWRDFDFHPSTGLIAARANNGVILADRTNLNGTTNIRGFFPPQGSSGAVVQNIQIVHNPACGDEFVVFNSRTSVKFPFKQSVLMYDLDGNQLTYDIQLSDGSSIDLDTRPSEFEFFDFFWDEDEQLLFVLDGINRDVYALTLKCADELCLGDANSDQVVNVADFIAVLLNFGSNGPIGDANDDGTVNVADFIAVLLNFGSSCS